jgi:hypothetical protein
MATTKNSITVSWAAVSGVSSYTVSYKEFGALDSTLISASQVSPYTINNLLKKTQYTITVVATKDNINSDPTSPIIESWTRPSAPF